MTVYQRCFGRKGYISRHSTTGFSQNVVAMETRYQTLEVSISLLGSLSKSVFERQTSIGSGFLHHWGVVGFKRSGKSVFLRENKLSNTNPVLASRHIKKGEGLPSD